MVTFITGNERKVKVLKLLLDPYKVEFDHIKLDLEEIQTKDPSTLVLRKVQEAYSQIKRACFVEDTEWSIPALNGFPGLFMKYVNEWFKVEDWIKLMKDYTS
jgi:inosine/xanthosine triphosphate pyrophosphatase family protein